MDKLKIIFTRLNLLNVRNILKLPLNIKNIKIKSSMTPTAHT